MRQERELQVEALLLPLYQVVDQAHAQITVGMAGYDQIAAAVRYESPNTEVIEQRHIDRNGRVRVYRDRVVFCNTAPNSRSLNWAHSAAMFSFIGKIEIRRSMGMSFSGFEPLLRSVKAVPADAVALRGTGDVVSPPEEDAAVAAGKEIRQFPVVASGARQSRLKKKYSRKSRSSHHRDTTLRREHSPSNARMESPISERQTVILLS